MVIDLDLCKTDSKTINFILRADARHETLIKLDLESCKITFDRSHSDDWSKGVCHTVLRNAGKKNLQIRIFSDTSSLEIYTDGNSETGYKTVMSGNIFPDKACTKIFIEATDGNAYFDKIETFEIESVW